MADLSPVQQAAIWETWVSAGQMPSGRWRIADAPAATGGRHHGWRGGLLEHQIEVAEIALLLADHHPPAERPPARRDLIIVGALLHDLGKSQTYDWTEDTGRFQAKRSILGRQLTHVEVGEHLWIKSWAASRAVGGWASAWSDADGEAIRHIIRTHHAVPVPPATLEALAVHLGDTASASLVMMHQWTSEGKRRVVGGAVGMGSTWRRLMLRGRLLLRRLGTG